jgi:hypothetical protein
MIALLALLTTLPILSGAPAVQDFNNVASLGQPALAAISLARPVPTPTPHGGDIAVTITTLGDGLRNDSRLDVDLIFDDGRLLEVPITGGIPDNSHRRLVAGHMFPSEHLAFVNVTLTGRSRDLENPDDFDLTSVVVELTEPGGRQWPIFTRRINQRLHGVGSWSSGLLTAYRPAAMQPTGRYIEANLYIGDQPVQGGSMELGVQEGLTTVWGTMTQNLRVDHLGWAHVTFSYVDHPLTFTRCTHLYLRQAGRGFNGFTLNGATFYVSVTGSVIPGGPTSTNSWVMYQALNINAKLAFKVNWASQGFLLRDSDQLREEP